MSDEKTRKKIQLTPNILRAYTETHVRVTHATVKVRV